MTTATQAQDERIVMLRETDAQEARVRSTAENVSAFDRRAIALATARHYAPIDCMHWSTTRTGSASYLVRSDSTRGLVYHVTIHPETDHRHECDCPAGTHHHPCKHIGISLILWAKFDRPVWIEERSH